MLKLKKMKFHLIIVTNQSGIARRIFSKDQFMNLTTWMIKILKKYKITLDAVYSCPHHPQDIIKKFKHHGNCRKPKPSMLLKAKENLNINMDKIIHDW